MSAAPYADPARVFLLTHAARLHGVMDSISATDWTDVGLWHDRQVRQTLDMLREELARAMTALDEVMP